MTIKHTADRSFVGLVRKAFSLVAIIASLWHSSLNGQTRCPLDTQSQDLPRGYIISGGEISMPIGAFVLVRQGDSIGAIRLTGIAPDPKGRPRANEWIGRVTYESYHQRGNAFSLTAPFAIKHSGDLVWERYKGFGFHYSWQPGNRAAWIGPWRFIFPGKNIMSMSTYSGWNGVKDKGFEIAPTAACELYEINLHDPKLKWFRYDREAPPVAILLTDLPK